MDFNDERVPLLLFFSAHTRDVQLRTCSNRDDFQDVLKEISGRKKKNASLTCVFGPPRFELERNELRQSNDEREI